MTKVFISYSHKDRNFVEKLVNDLQSRLPDIRLWYDMDIPAGNSWAETLSNEIESADVVLTILSPDYLASQWANRELELALLRKTEGKARLIPILVRPCQPTGFLQSLTWVDFTKDYESSLVKLIWGITGEKPRTIEGSKPGETSEAINPKELASLKSELKEAVRLFKSRTEDIKLSSKKNDIGIKEKDVCFIIMPFNNPDLQIVFEDFLKPVIENDCNLICERGDDVFGSSVIMDDIIKSINEAKLIVADLTGKNANVFYEVGISHTLDKAVLLLAQSIDDVPFDLRHRRVLLYDYSPRGCKRLEGILKDNISALLNTIK
jgi:hypothetical protein